jgi:hypothetical protein
LKVSHATLNERISHLPTKAYIGWWIAGGLTVAAAALTVLSRLGWPVAATPKQQRQPRRVSSFPGRGAACVTIRSIVRNAAPQIRNPVCSANITGTPDQLRTTR